MIHDNVVASLVVVTENFVVSHWVPLPKTSISSDVHANAAFVSKHVATTANSACDNFNKDLRINANFPPVFLPVPKHKTALIMQERLEVQDY